MVTFTTTIKRDDRSREKTGWSYIIISAANAKKLVAGSRLGFRVKGSIDSYALNKTSVLPMGDGSFMLPVNGTMRRAIGKESGDKVTLVLDVDKRKIELSKDLMASLADEPGAFEFFKSLPMSHQQYFSKWIESAKTVETKTKRIVMSVNALSQKKGYGEMIREEKRMKM
ncbi:YdeI/OmpD-associated family protein [Chryseolinea sp. T2]|uniref:YdeI/OmpD-associated family protein n=1 Tax=Chryseolinea sp. T2 TaxID=3129255 RepID=UPI0030768ADF